MSEDLVPPPVDIIRDLREKILSYTPEQAGVSPTPTRPRVWGALMELGLPKALASVVVIGEGTVSLYLGNGGGVIGAGQHEAVWQVATHFLDAAEVAHDWLEPTTGHDLPRVGYTRLYLHTFRGLRTTEVLTDEITDTHLLGPLCLAGHRLIHAIQAQAEVIKRERGGHPGGGDG